MKVDKLIEKTTESEESKKWKVIVGIVVGLVFGGVLFVGGYIITEDIADSYIASKPIMQHSAFYNSQIGNNATSVYFIGSSVIGTAVYCPLIDSILQEQGYDIETYNLHLGSDRPRIRAMEIDEIIASQPSLVVYGTTYTNMVGDDVEPDYIIHSSNSPLFNQNLSIFFTEEELSTVTYNYLFPKRGYIIHGFAPYLTSILSSTSNEEHLRYLMKEGYSPDVLMAYEDEHYDINNIKQMASTSYSNLDFKTDAAMNNAAALVYSINCLEEAGIPVVLINMPIHSIVSNAIPDDARKDYYEILDSTGVEWINAENSLEDEYMYDHFHKTWGGCQKFSEMMADLIIQEMS